MFNCFLKVMLLHCVGCIDVLHKDQKRTSVRRNKSLIDAMQPGPKKFLKKKRMNRIYCISGLGTDEKIFRNLSVPGYELEHIPWLTPNNKETIIDYAKRMMVFITDAHPVILGVSFGGMIAIEIAKMREVKKIILISSIKTTSEMPSWMKIAGRLKLHKIFPVRSNKLTEKFDDAQLGVSNVEEKILVDHYRKITDPVYQSWAIDKVLNWRNHSYPHTIVHIHGDKDKVFPIRKIRSTYVIEGGSHIMILNKAQQISFCINEIMTEKILTQ